MENEKQAMAIAFSRILPVPLPHMPQEVQEALHAIFRPLHSTCTRCCGSNTYFRYFDNYKTALHLQPRYHCRDCRKCFTAGGKPQVGVLVGGTHRHKKGKEAEPKAKRQNKRRKSDDDDDDDEPSQRLYQAKRTRRGKLHEEDLNMAHPLTSMPSGLLQEEQQHSYLDWALCDILLKMLEEENSCKKDGLEDQIQIQTLTQMQEVVTAQQHDVINVEQVHAQLQHHDRDQDVVNVEQDPEQLQHHDRRMHQDVVNVEQVDPPLPPAVYMEPSFPTAYTSYHDNAAPLSTPDWQGMDDFCRQLYIDELPHQLASCAHWDHIEDWPAPPPPMM